MKKLKTYENFEPEMEWEEDENFKQSETYFVKEEDWDEFVDILKWNGYRHRFDFDSREFNIEKNSYSRDNIIRVYILNEITKRFCFGYGYGKYISFKDAKINESFNPEEYWEEEDEPETINFKQSETYFVKEEDWDEFVDILKSNGYKHYKFDHDSHEFNIGKKTYTRDNIIQVYIDNEEKREFCFGYSSNYLNFIGFKDAEINIWRRY